MKFYAALRCWPIRDELTPSAVENKRRFPTWEQWFAKRYGESLEEYAARAKRQNIRQQVLDFELATFGSSPLQKSAEAA
jgi:hypothetical protein